MSKRVVISGYYGFGNIGDEAVLSGILATFRKLGLDVNVTVLSSDPARTIAEHPGAEAVHRYKLAPVIGAIRRADLVISGGGSLLQDATSTRSSYYYLFILRLAQLLRRRTMVYAQGVGPLNSPSIQKAVARTLNKVHAITVRDEDSKQLLERIGITRAPVHLSADPAFMLEPDKETAKSILAKSGLGGKELLGVSLRPWPNVDEQLRQIGMGTRKIADELGIDIALIPMQESRDIEACEVVKDAVLLRNIGSVEAVKGIVSECSLILGMRLHCLIFAASEGVPFIPVVYDPKVSSIAQMCDQPDGVNVETATAEAVINAIRSAWSAREMLKEKLLIKSHDLEALALVSGKIAAQLLAQ